MCRNLREFLISVYFWQREATCLTSSLRGTVLLIPRLSVAAGHSAPCRFLAKNTDPSLLLCSFFVCVYVGMCVCVCVCECVRVLHKTAVHVAVIKSFPWLSQVEVRASQTHPPCTCHSLSLSLSLCVHMCLFFPLYLFFFSHCLCFTALFFYTSSHSPPHFYLNVLLFQSAVCLYTYCTFIYEEKNPTGWPYMSNDLCWHENHK